MRDLTLNKFCPALEMRAFGSFILVTVCGISTVTVVEKESRE